MAIHRGHVQSIQRVAPRRRLRHANVVVMAVALTGRVLLPVGAVILFLVVVFLR